MGHHRAEVMAAGSRGEPSQDRSEIEVSSSAVGITVAPGPVPDWVVEAVRIGGASIVGAEEAEALIWLSHGSKGLSETLDKAPYVRWVQLASAGIEWLFREGVYRPEKIWTCAKGVYGPNAAELAVTLLLCGYRDMRRFLRADAWLPAAGRSLQGEHVGVIGSGGVGRSALSLLGPLGARTTALNLSGRPVPEADSTHPIEELPSIIGGLDALVLAAPLTTRTEGLVDSGLLAAMKEGAWLINVARGKLVDTDALVEALRDGTIGGAGLDVTDPEPLPTGHPLWALENCIITPHVANTLEMSPGPYRERITDNVSRFVQGRTLEGVIDGELQY